MSDTLEETGRFVVEVATTPPNGAPAEKWDAFRPDLAQHDVVLSNYNDYPGNDESSRWPAEVERGIEAFVAGGGGLVIIHAANNAFSHWQEYNKMIGLGWRSATFGDRIKLDDDGQIIRIPKDKGTNASHGKIHAYRITVRRPDHPAMKSMPTEWMHAKDELYDSQRGPAENMEILASAYSDPDTGGSGAHEPIVWTVRYGKGHVFTTVMGHVKADFTDPIRCVGFQAIMCRGAEWAATGRVTLQLPEDFPTADDVRMTSVE